MSKIISPSLLSCDFANIESEIKKLESAGADWLHIDVMDGHFVPNLTLGPVVVKSIKKVTQLPLDVHLMITDPDKYIPAFAQAGANILTVHIETLKNPIETLNLIKSFNIKVGLTLRPATPLDAIKNYLHLVDLVLVMTVEPGFGGQKFMTDQVDKISELKKIKVQQSLSYIIEVDGGVNESTLSYIKDAEAIVAGNYIFSEGVMKDKINLLRNA